MNVQLRSQAGRRLACLDERERVGRVVSVGQHDHIETADIDHARFTSPIDHPARRLFGYLLSGQRKPDPWFAILATDIGLGEYAWSALSPCLHAALGDDVLER